MAAPDEDRLIVMGQVAGLFGVRGWVKLMSYAEPREAILGYTEWYLGDGEHWRPVEPAESRFEGAGIAVRLAGVRDRDAALALVGEQIAVPRRCLPVLEAGRYYWADLEGLRVENPRGAVLGRVARMMATPAHAVMVVGNGRERLIPFVPGDRVLDVDLENGVIRVDWEPDW